MLVISRFRGDAADLSLGPQLEQALEVLSEQRGYVRGAVGRNVDDPGLWLLQTEWEGPGAYRRALSFDVFRPEAFRGLAEAWRGLGRGAEAACAIGAVVALGAGNDLELSGMSSRVVRAAAQAPGSLDASELSSIVLIEDGRAWTQSDAALRITRRLSRPWPLLWATRVLPRFMRDGEPEDPQPLREVRLANTGERPRRLVGVGVPPVDEGEAARFEGVDEPR